MINHKKEGMVSHDLPNTFSVVQLRTYILSLKKPNMVEISTSIGENRYVEGALLSKQERIELKTMLSIVEDGGVLNEAQRRRYYQLNFIAEGGDRSKSEEYANLAVLYFADETRDSVKDVFTRFLEENEVY